MICRPDQPRQCIGSSEHCVPVHLPSKSLDSTSTPLFSSRLFPLLLLCFSPGPLSLFSMTETCWRRKGNPDNSKAPLPSRTREGPCYFRLITIQPSALLLCLDHRFPTVYHRLGKNIFFCLSGGEFQPLSSFRSLAARETNRASVRPSSKPFITQHNSDCPPVSPQPDRQHRSSHLLRQQSGSFLVSALPQARQYP